MAASSSGITTRLPKPHLIPCISASDISSQLRVIRLRRVERKVDSAQVTYLSDIGLLVMRYRRATWWVKKAQVGRSGLGQGVAAVIVTAFVCSTAGLANRTGGVRTSKQREERVWEFMKSTTKREVKVRHEGLICTGRFQDHLRTMECMYTNSTMSVLNLAGMSHKIVDLRAHVFVL